MNSDMVCGYFSIRPIENLNITAFVLGQILGVEFEEELTGRYEEFPAYTADSDGVAYALLGEADPEYDVRQTRSGDFHLMVRANSTDASQDLIRDIFDMLSQDRWVIWRVME